MAVYYVHCSFFARAFISQWVPNVLSLPPMHAFTLFLSRAVSHVQHTSPSTLLICFDGRCLPPPLHTLSLSPHLSHTNTYRKHRFHHSHNLPHLCPQVLGCFDNSRLPPLPTHTFLLSQSPPLCHPYHPLTLPHRPILLNISCTHFGLLRPKRTPRSILNCWGYVFLCARRAHLCVLILQYREGGGG